MSISDFAVLGTGGIASLAAIVATVADRFGRITAGCFALASGTVPWLFLAMLHDWLPGSTALSAITIFGSGPLFLLAFLLYGLGERTPGRGIAASACLIGMLGGIGFTALLAGQMAWME